jgi:hypothetical protein
MEAAANRSVDRQGREAARNQEAEAFPDFFTAALARGFLALGLFARALAGLAFGRLAFAGFWGSSAAGSSTP